MKSNILSYFKVFLINSLIFLIGLFLIELLFILYVKSHSLQSTIELPKFLKHYIKFNITDIIQNKEDCAKFDKELFYTLRTGKCIFDIADSTEEFSINSLGVRDDEESLIEPEIVFLGDSYTMGWGVANEETYAKLLENKTRRKVLNTGISSYGTAREISLLERVDTSNLQYLIIQYCPNDHEENLSYLKNNHVLKVSSEEKFKELVTAEKAKSSYYPGKHLIEIFHLLKKSSTEKREYSKLLKNFAVTNIDKSKATEFYPNFEIEAEFLYSANSNQFIHLNGWANGNTPQENIKSIAFFINGQEAPSKIQTGIERLDIKLKGKSLDSYKIGWSAEVLLPEKIKENQSIEKIVKDNNDKLYNVKNQKEWIIPFTRENQAETFLKVLRSYKKDLPSKVQVIVFALHDYESNDPNFIESVERIKRNKDYPNYINNLKTLNVQSSMTRDDFFRVDDHINAKGHKLVAEKLYELIRKP